MSRKRSFHCLVTPIQLLKRQSDGLEHHDLLKPDEVVIVVQPIAGATAPARLQKSKPVIVVQGPDRNARPLGELA
jgi:hypothetical protein